MRFTAVARLRPQQDAFFLVVEMNSPLSVLTVNRVAYVL